MWVELSVTIHLFIFRALSPAKVTRKHAECTNSSKCPFILSWQSRELVTTNYEFATKTALCAEDCLNIKWYCSPCPCVSSSGSTTCVCRIVMRYETYIYPDSRRVCACRRKHYNCPSMYDTQRKHTKSPHQINFRKTSWLVPCASSMTWRQRILE